MSGRLRIGLSREGRYYVFVLAFIVGGAVLREVNLLVVLAALMMGPLLFSWRAVVTMMRRLRVRRRLPRRISAGDPLTVGVLVANQRRTIPTWGLLIEDQVRDVTLDEPGGEPASPVEIMIPRIGAGDELAGEYRLSLTRRGRYAFGPWKISTSFPFGFLRGSIAGTATDSLVVCPRVGRLTRHWHERVASIQVGQQRSQRRRGLAEGDYYGLREWRPGDSRRWIHWRTTAKLGSLSVLQFEELRHRDLAVIVELWLPDEPTEEDRGYVELAVSFVATIVVELGRRGGCELAVAIAGAESDCWAATASRVFAQEVLEHLAVARGSSHSNVAAAEARLTPWIRRGARPMVISTRPVEAAARSSDTSERPRRIGGFSGHTGTDWFSVRDEQLDRYFRLELPKS